MADIFDYLDWRGDLHLSKDPFNDIDNLILAMLAYTSFDGLIPEDGTAVPLQQVCEGYFAEHSRDEARWSNSHFDRAPLLMYGMLAGDRFRDTMLSDYIDIVDPKHDIQISAVTYILPDDTLYIAFRGTDRTVVGWKEDFSMSFLRETGGQKKAAEYLDMIGSETEHPIRIGGHSKGGNFAIYAAAKASPEIKSRILAVYTNDGPGFRQEFVDSEEYAAIQSKIISIVPETSIIGMLLASKARKKVVDSSEKGFAQHDGLTWQVMGNEFVQTELTNEGIFIRETQENWLSKLDDESRERFVKILFSLAEATGEETFAAMLSSGLRSLERIISAAQGLSKESKQHFKRVVAELLQSGGDNAKNWYGR